MAEHVVHGLSHHRPPAVDHGPQGFQSVLRHSEAPVCKYYFGLFFYVCKV